MRVVVLMGGSSPERSVSLATGAGVARALEERGHQVLALDPADGSRVSLSGSGAPAIGESPGADAPGDERSLVLAKNAELGSADVVFIALHGGIGEDGTLQALLDLSKVPYTGSGMLASALAMDKHRAKMMFRAAKIPTPRGRLLHSPKDSFDPEALGGFPLVVKPNAGGSSVAVHIVKEPAALKPAIEDAFRYPPVLVEEFIPGRELTVAVLEGRALPAVEIIPEEGFYDFRHKYSKGHTRYEVPAELSGDTAAEAARLAELTYRSLGCSGVARIDFRLTGKGNLYCLEANTIPGMTGTSLVPMAAGAVGISYEELVERLVTAAKARG